MYTLKNILKREALLRAVSLWDGGKICPYPTVATSSSAMCGILVLRTFVCLLDHQFFLSMLYIASFLFRKKQDRQLIYHAKRIALLYIDTN
ncbi:hypothetical protein Hanom_Chr10g00950281 [Helianthus anomalus]